MSKPILDNTLDDNVDDYIYQCFNPTNPKSFFLFAGAGSGKTRTLVNVLSKFKNEFGDSYKLYNQKIAIITYTNAAADEIKHRLEFDSIFYVSTIHSFSWELIKSLTTDIKKWLKLDLDKSIAELEEAQSKSRDLKNKTSVDRARKIESKQNRLNNLSQITKFVYNPNGDNVSKDSLNHSEVISITSYFIQTKTLMQDVIVSKFPIVLVDESQDTKKELIDALFTLQQNKKDNFSLGLFGDIMQRIYSDGKEDLGINLPADWLRPAKQLNHRSNKRIVKLINEIRKDVDGQEQMPRTEKMEGFVRLYIVDRISNKTKVEETVSEKMFLLTKDPKWGSKDYEVMTLVLEHHMAAKRMGFFELFEPLYRVEKFKTGLLDGSLSFLSVFTKIVLPLVEAYKKNDKFSIARIVKQYSIWLDKKTLEKAKNQTNNIKIANESVNKLLALWEDDKDPKLIEILDIIKANSLFPIHNMLNIITSRTEEEKENFRIQISDEEEDEKPDYFIEALDIVIQTAFSQVENYCTYLSNKSAFSTHQGVKGLEYPRVMVIIDDVEARGFMFSYDKLFGSKDLTADDKNKVNAGKETGIDRTKRLFYVACSRAKESLAIVAYTDNPTLVKENVKKYGWFHESEIELL
ncbi:UvrD-helicase domain-containing protein [Aquirufa ecclesiirivi]|uniref:UvrD-helicase domain-containing protein n=1 Tax=Aquirufa ecclesiirivi TaxID=2715124 RepID=UPI001409A529|nr:UvrD-helicase domain-containing protein [Aquirufa ecclesiirivi]NHC50238.1 ATP-dependent helicase [Aquirufa ecclesiirivi]